MLKFFVNRVKHIVLCPYLLDILGLHLKILKICVFPVVQLYVEIFELVNRFEVLSILI